MVPLKRLLIGAGCFVNLSVHIEMSLHSLLCACAESLCVLHIVAEFEQGGGQCLRIVGGGEQGITLIGDQFGNPTAGGCDDGQSEGGGFEQGDGCAFVA